MAKVTKLQAAIDRIQGDIDILEAAKARLVAEDLRTTKKIAKKGGPKAAAPVGYAKKAAAALASVQYPEEV
jgi:hypothetical protein